MSDNSQQHRSVLMLVTRGVVGGTQRSVLSLSRTLTDRGHHVVLGFGDGTFLERECLAAGLPFRRFRSLRRSLNPLVMITFMIRIWQTLYRERYDVLHLNSSNTLFAAIAARFVPNRPRIVFTFRGLSFLDPNVSLHRVTRCVYEWLFWFLLRFVDEPVFVSAANKAYAESAGIVQEGHVILNGLDSASLVFRTGGDARNELRALSGNVITESTFVVGSIGRLADQKNYEFLIYQARELVDQYPNLAFVIIGDGEERPHLSFLIEQYELEQHVLLVGEVAHASSLIRGFDVFVLPSRYEGLSITLIEALYAGVPVLASDVGGAREQFSHAPFQLFPVDDGATFRDRLTKFIENPSVRRECAEANASRSPDFDIQRVANRYYQLYTHA